MFHMGKALLILFLSLISIQPCFSDTVSADSIQLENKSSEQQSIGVLLNLNDKLKESICTATHIALGKVLTSARCVSLSGDPGQYRLIYFNQENQRMVAPVEKIYFTGPSWVDIAVLTISNATAKNWAVAGSEVKQYPVQNVFDQYWNDSSESENVEVWGYLPTENSNVLKFAKSKCTAARKVPVIEMKVRDGESEKTAHEWQVTGADVNPDHVLFLDSCSVPVSQGKGSLVTVQKNFSKKIAVLSQYNPDLGKVYTVQSQSQYKDQEISYFYRGILPPTSLLKKDFSDLVVTLATLLQSAQALKKELFQKLY